MENKNIKDPIVQKSLRIRESDYKKYKIFNRENIPFHKWFNDMLNLLECNNLVDSCEINSIFNENLLTSEIVNRYITDVSKNKLKYCIKTRKSFLNSNFLNDDVTYWELKTNLNKDSIEKFEKTFSCFQTLKDSLVCWKQLENILILEFSDYEFIFESFDHSIYSINVLSNITRGFQFGQNLELYILDEELKLELELELELDKDLSML